MAMIQLIIPDEDRARFVHQAQREGLSLSVWLRAAARERLEQRSKVRQFEAEKDLAAFFAKCDKAAGPGAEPDWEQHLAVINESRRRGTT